MMSENLTVAMPTTYIASLGVRETQIAIKLIKDYFETRLAGELQLTRVSAPLFVHSRSGYNDTLNG
ncbi:MAG TPA: aspartate--ammonia ligase, partial [Firmicutes bacterium]|nr:aspartate--ammonia ligase [Bacillota bacterium]